MFVNANALRFPLINKSVQCIITSPPYFNKRDYGVEGQLGLESTIEEYVNNLVMVGRECWRVLKDDGVFYLNLGDSYIGSGNSGGMKTSTVGSFHQTKTLPILESIETMKQGQLL